ncbi:Clavata3/ESR (CLE) gene family member [Arachis hypogaea]|nr:Clavata3/ESR (CLE) gene family member [Arachis hypogaea]
MRLSELVLLLWLLLWACVGTSNTAFEGAKNNNRSVQLQDNNNNNANKFNGLKNTTTTSSESDEKRVVPTGPNPLHNKR